MNKTTKIFITLFTLLAVVSGVFAMAKMMSGNYFSTVNTALPIFYILIAVAVLIVIFKGLKYMWTSLAIACIMMTSCHYAKSNQQVVISEDCGMTWKKINTGDAVPRQGMNKCYMKVVMPNYPMQGDCKFVSNFSERVRANVHIDYDYNIVDQLAFIKQAKYLGSANANADSEDALSASAFEGAENSVIDKRIREISKSLFLKEDIVELNQADLESLLHTESNKLLEPLGIHLNFITLTFDLDEQTRQAIDVATAMKVYESKGISDIGKAVMVARASATKITLETETKETKEK